MTLKLEVGKTYLDGYKRKVRIICTDRPGMMTCVGLVNGIDPLLYNSDGTKNLTYDKRVDLVSEHKEPEYRWMNLYDKESSGRYFTTKEAADSTAESNSTYLLRIALIRIDLSSGEVVSEKI